MKMQSEQYAAPDFELVQFEQIDVVAIDISTTPPPDDRDAVIVW